jgi:hypothetical protein
MLIVALPPAAIRQTASWSAPVRFSSHSAHIGQEVQIHYRWHPLHGPPVKLCGVEQRATGRVVHVEVAPGVITVVAAWMLDPVICAAMQIGAPCVSVSALVELHHLLVELGLRASSADDSDIVREEPSDQVANIGVNSVAIATDGTAAAQHCIRFHRASGNEFRGAREGARAVGAPLDAGSRRSDRGA